MVGVLRKLLWWVSVLAELRASWPPGRSGTGFGHKATGRDRSEGAERSLIRSQG